MEPEQMVCNTVVYLLSRQNRLTPFTKSELIKEAMNGQHKAFEDVLKDVKKSLKKVFLKKLIGCDVATTKAGGFSSYILVGLVPSTISDSPNDLQKDPSRALLGLILTFIFMEQAAIDEDVIWSSVHKLNLQRYICNKGELNRKDLRKFLKTEYCAKRYLSTTATTAIEGQDEKLYYDWGLRSQYEFSKIAMLKRVAKRCGNTDLKSYKNYADAIAQLENFAIPYQGDPHEMSTDESQDDEESSREKLSQKKSKPSESKDPADLETQSLANFSDDDDDD